MLPLELCSCEIDRYNPQYHVFYQRFNGLIKLTMTGSKALFFPQDKQRRMLAQATFRPVGLA